MIVVIQCAAKKRYDAGFLKTRQGQPVLFVANPALAPRDSGLAYATPDRDSDYDQSWRQVLLSYNQAPGNNPLRLVQAYELYHNDAYRRLVDRFGTSNTFILSAGWGLVSASFLKPMYDITFSAAAEAYKRRMKGDSYCDFQMLPADCEEEIVFFGGRDYLPLFCSLTDHFHSKRTVFYNSSFPPIAAGCSLIRFVTTTRTNWHYECVNQFLGTSRTGG